MARLSSYMFVTLNGFYKGPADDISWHTHGEEEARYSMDALAGDNVLVFGRRTYDQMAAYWPTELAAEQFPAVADGMNRAEKIVFSRTEFAPAWRGTRCVTGDIVADVRSRKRLDKDMTVLGSGSIVSLFAQHGLIDRYEIMIDPVAIGGGTPIFDGITHELALQLVDHRVFTSGTVLLGYEPTR